MVRVFCNSAFKFDRETAHTQVKNVRPVMPGYLHRAGEGLCNVTARGPGAHWQRLMETPLPAAAMRFKVGTRGLHWGTKGLHSPALILHVADDGGMRARPHARSADASLRNLCHGLALRRDHRGSPLLVCLAA